MINRVTFFYTKFQKHILGDLSDHSREVRYKIELIYHITIFYALSIFFTNLVGFQFVSNGQRLSSSIGILSAVIVPFLLKYKIDHLKLAHLFLWGNFIATMGSVIMTTSGEMQMVTGIWFVVLLIFAYLVLGKQVALFFMTIFTIFSIFAAYLNWNNVDLFPKPKYSTEEFLIAEPFLMLIPLAFIWYILKRYMDYREELQLEILQSQQLLRKLTEQLPGFIYKFILHTDGTSSFPYASKGIEDIYEVSSQEVATNASLVFERLHPNDFDDVMYSINQSFQNLSIWDHTYRVQLPKKGTRWVKGVARPIKLENGDVLWHGYIQDVTAAKESEEEMQKLSLVASKIHNGVVITDKKGYAEWVNEAFTRISGYPLSEVKGRKPGAVLQGEATDQKTIRYIHHKLKTKKPFTFEILNYNKSGNPYWNEITVTPLLDKYNELTGFIGVQNDISERKKYIEELKNAKAHADQANKSKSEFLANMSHEIRTPLNGIIGFSDLLINSPMSNVQKEHMKTVYDSAQSLLDLINDILDFSKIEAGKLELDIEYLNLEDVIQKVGEISKYQAFQQDLEFILNLSQDIPQEVAVDGVRLRQILVNLLSNAIKFTSSGEVEISVEVVEKLNNDQSILRFTVRDTGIGIPESAQSKIFKAFSQADSSTTRKFGGTGLGLTITNQLLNLMNSHLQLRSKPGAGSTFFFDLVLPVKYQAPQKLTYLSGKKALVLDKNIRVARMVADLLQSEGFYVRYVDNVDKGMRLLEAAQPFDLLFIDQQCITIRSGQVIKNYGESIDVIVLQRKAVEVSHDQLTIRGRLNKPVTRQGLREVLVNIYEGSSPLISEEIKHVQVAGSDNNIRILVAEDNEINLLLVRSFVTEMVAHENYFEARDGEEALELFKKHKPDVVITDIQMPRMNGYELSESIRKLEFGKDTTIIALTAGAIKGDREKSLDSGMDDYLAKPIVRQQFFSVIEKWVQKKLTHAVPKMTQKNEFDGMEEKLMELSNQDKDTYKQLVNVSYEMLQSSVNLVEKAIATKDFREVKRIGHKTKGTALALKLERLIEVADKLENNFPEELEEQEMIVYEFKIATNEFVKVLHQLKKDM